MIFSLSSLWGGEQFIFSARTFTQSHILAYDEISISPSMQQRNKKVIKVCQIPLKAPLAKSAYEFLLEHKIEVAECFISSSVRVFDKEEQSLYLGISQTDTTVLPVYFTVEFKEDLATLYLLRK